ncbi:hypothetical protein Q7O_000648 [Pectobacterium carotovorum subsp. carotovorum PCCS1]|nr:hypothetical protein [Pectobacterium carotovorum subsp. carotovorum PCCS1]
MTRSRRGTGFRDIPVAHPTVTSPQRNFLRERKNNKNLHCYLS